MNIVHIGLGARGRHWLEIVRDHADFTSVAGVDPDVSARSWTTTQFPRLSQACYAHLEEALETTEADAAIIASPPARHASQAITALQAGLAVMIESPFASSVADATLVVEAARRAGRPVMVAQNLRYARCERGLRRLVREGRLGTVTHVRCIDHRWRPAQASDLDHVDYCQVLDAGAHHFDTLRAVLGVNPVSVMARCGRAPWSEFRHGSTTEALLELENDIHVQYHGSLTAHRDEHALWIEGDRGVLWTDRFRIWWRKRGWPLFLPIRSGRIPPGDAGRHPREGTATLLAQLKGALGGTVPETNGEDNLWSLAMVEAVMRSDRTGNAVRIADVLSAAGSVRTLADRDGRVAGS